MTPSTTLRALIVAFIAIAPVASTVADQTQTSPSVNPTKSRAPGDQPKPKKSKNGTSDISNQQALNMQEFNDRRTQAYESLSNIEKKEAKTGDAIVANVKTGKPTPKPKSNPMPKKTPKPQRTLANCRVASRFTLTQRLKSGDGQGPSRNDGDYKVNPIIILQAIAAGVLGNASFGDGGWAAALGLVLQWSMSIVIAACCVLASDRIAPFKRHWITAGLIYGVITFFVMNYIVVPLSAVREIHAFSTEWFVENMSAMLLFGLIVVFVSNRSLREPETK